MKPCRRCAFWKEQWGLVFAAISTGIVGGLIPPLIGWLAKTTLRQADGTLPDFELAVLGLQRNRS